MLTAMSPPDTVEELVERAKELSGITLGELFAKAQCFPPSQASKGKGRIGQCLEQCLGADGANFAQPDFKKLKIELKTIPVTTHGRVCESTFVTTIALCEIGKQRFDQSALWRKLRRILWFPIESDKSIPFGSRRVGFPTLWSPESEDREIIERDYQELVELIASGHIEYVTAHLGNALQVRPKGANRFDKVKAPGPNGEWVDTMPRAFYLRPSFTQRIIDTFYDFSEV